MSERPSLDVDIVCVGFGPATGGFLTELARRCSGGSRPPPLVICYERSDDIGFGVSGAVTAARAIKESFPQLDPAAIPMAVPVGRERVAYLLDPIGASRRSRGLRAADAAIRACRWALPFEHEALNLPWTPSFLRKDGGLVLSIGQFMQWVATQVLGSGMVQIWPSMPVAGPLFEGDKVAGVRLIDQGTDRRGNPADGFVPGMNIRACRV